MLPLAHSCWPSWCQLLHWPLELQHIHSAVNFALYGAHQLLGMDWEPQNHLCVHASQENPVLPAGGGERKMREEHGLSEIRKLKP